MTKSNESFIHGKAELELVSSIKDYVSSLETKIKDAIFLLENGNQTWKALDVLKKGNSKMDNEKTTLEQNAARYMWLRENCIKTVPADRDGPAYKRLLFMGELQSDWRTSIDHFGLDIAIDMARHGK